MSIMSNGCKTLVISCIDFRLHDALHQRANDKLGPKCYDLIHVAGGGRSFLDEDATQYMLRQVGLSVKLHGTQGVVLVNHEDCGTYGGKASFTDDHAERQRHHADLRQAANLIKEQHPDLKITLAFQLLDGTVLMVDMVD